MRQRVRGYKQKRAAELEHNLHFKHTKHLIHRLMHAFLAIIVIEWLIVFIADGLSVGGLVEIALAVALHFVVETIILHGFNVTGGIIILVDVSINASEFLRIQLDEGIKVLSWHTAINVAFMVVLYCIGLTMIFNKDIKKFSHRSREILQHLTIKPHIHK